MIGLPFTTPRNVRVVAVRAVTTSVRPLRLFWSSGRKILGEVNGGAALLCGAAPASNVPTRNISVIQIARERDERENIVCSSGQIHMVFNRTLELETVPACGVQHALTQI